MPGRWEAPILAFPAPFVWFPREMHVFSLGDEKTTADGRPPAVVSGALAYFPPTTPASLAAVLPLPIATAAAFFCSALILVLP